MIKVDIRIGDNDPLDSYAGWGLIYLSADTRTSAPIKQRETTSYAEEAGEHTDNRTVADAFDYKIMFAVEARNRDLTNANAVIKNFNDAICERESGSDIARYKTITIYNYRDRVKITGLPQPIAEPKSLYRRCDGTTEDCAEIELSIRVSDPRLCDFNLKVDEEYRPIHKDPI